jgi:hypothetical protein
VSTHSARTSSKGERTRDIIIRLALQGIGPREISNRTGIDYEYARVTTGEARRSGIPIPSFRQDDKADFRRVLLSLPHTITSQYRKEAKRRRIPLEQFVSTLLVTIAADNLFTAIADTDDAA